MRNPGNLPPPARNCDPRLEVMERGSLHVGHTFLEESTRHRTSITHGWLRELREQVVGEMPQILVILAKSYMFCTCNFIC